MSRDAGVSRDAAGLRRLLAELDALEALYGQAAPLVAARLVAQAAEGRRESRGAHHRTDFPAACRPRTAYDRHVDRTRPRLARRRRREPARHPHRAGGAAGAQPRTFGRAGDVTAAACLPAEARFAAVFAARRPGVVAGLDCARLAFQLLDRTIAFEAALRDGDVLAPGTVLARVEGNARAAAVRRADGAEPARAPVGDRDPDRGLCGGRERNGRADR
jgi:hypothetical protein